ncbi:MAG: hypothetical protein LBB61_06210 [Treponema sp.]|jgi:hypothetical protein|nr:hypothetical protein [Treponema sp.]
MAKITDWVPGKRANQLVRARNRIGIMMPETRTAWGIPESRFTELKDIHDSAEILLQKSMSGERTPVITEQCKEAFDALTAKIRFFKAHYFLLPPLTNADLVNLGFTIRDPHPAPSRQPTAEVTAETYLVGRRELGLWILYASGNPEDKANKGCRIWYKVVPSGGEPARSPKERSESFYTRRRKDMVTFDYEELGKTAYIAV